MAKASSKQKRKQRTSKQEDPAAVTPGQPSPRLTGWRKWAMRLALVVIAPLLALGLLEAGLLLFGYGHSADYFEKRPDGKTITTNRKFALTVFPKALARVPTPVSFPAEKGPKTYRIVVLGGSAARGVPDPAFSFARFLEVMLNDQFPQAKFEVINVGMTAINSHVVLRIARESARYQPDLFVIYMGNNEVVGPYGPGTVFKGFSPSRRLIQASFAVRGKRTGQLLESLIGSLGSGQGGPREWLGMAMFLNNRVAADDPRLEDVYANYKANLIEICDIAQDARAGVLLCTVGVNLKDCAPFASLHKKGLSANQQSQWQKLYDEGVRAELAGTYAEAMERYQSASAIDDRYAALHYRVGRCELASGRGQQAAHHFERARDLDALRFRADSRINEIIRTVADSQGDRGVDLVDVETVLRGSEFAPEGIPGRELFYEHVHLTPYGDYAVANALYSAVTKKLGLAVPAGAKPPPPPTWLQFADLLPITFLDRSRAVAAMLEMTDEPPFSHQLDHSLQSYGLLQDQLVLRMRASPADDVKAYQAAIARRGDDAYLRSKLADRQIMMRDFAGAEATLRALLDRMPNQRSALVLLGVSLHGQGKTEQAKEQFEQVISTALRPEDPYRVIGEKLCRIGHQPDGIAYLRQGLAEYPWAMRLCNSLGVQLATQGENTAAIEVFKAGLELDPNNQRTHHNVASVYMEVEQFDQAVTHLQRSLQLDPTAADDHQLLALSLARLGKREDSLKHLALATELDRYNFNYCRQRASALLQAGRPDQAADEYRRGLGLDGEWISGLVGLARLQATCRDQSLIDLAGALKMATKACELTSRSVAEPLDVLAMVYAATGNFEQAITTARKAEQIAEQRGDREQAAEIRARLRLYREGTAYRL